jgi:AcrR family transcriptional regulator
MPPIWADTLDEHRALVLQRLLEAFGALVAERGVEATTLAAVAQRAGIARSAVYNYVRDKHDLLLAHAASTLDSAAQELAAALSADAPPAERLARYVAAAFRGFASEPGGDLMSLLDPDQQRQLLAHLAPMREMLEQILSDGLGDGSFGDASVEELSGFVTATLGGYRLPLAHGLVDPDEGAEVCTRLLLHGLSGGAGTRRPS